MTGARLSHHPVVLQLPPTLQRQRRNRRQYAETNQQAGAGRGDIDLLRFPRLDGLMVDVAPMATIEQLLEILSEYLELEDTDCQTLPPAAYRSSDLYELEIEKIFKKSWLCVGRAEYVSDPGDYYVFDLLGDMLVIVHGEDGEIHALSNVCRHRSTPPPPNDLSFTHMRCGMNQAFRSGGHAMTPTGHLDTFIEEDLSTGYLVYVWPAFTMAMRPNGNNWLSFLPKGPERTGILGGYMEPPDLVAATPDIAEQRREVIARVNEQDKLATTELAKAMHSSKAARGPLAPFEQTIAQFYRWLARELVGGQALSDSRMRSTASS